MSEIELFGFTNFWGGRAVSEFFFLLKILILPSAAIKMDTNS